MSAIVVKLKDTDIITAHQCGFIGLPGKILADNIRQTLNVMDQAQIEKADLLLLTLDAEKAFIWCIGPLCLRQ